MSDYDAAVLDHVLRLVRSPHNREAADREVKRLRAEVETLRAERDAATIAVREIMRGLSDALGVPTSAPHLCLRVKVLREERDAERARAERAERERDEARAKAEARPAVSALGAADLLNIARFIWDDASDEAAEAHAALREHAGKVTR